MLAPRVFLAIAALAVAQAQTPPNTFPQAYPGIPNTNSNFSDSQAWQDCKFYTLPFSARIQHFVALDFLVKEQLPNMTFSLQRSFAGNIPVNRQGHPNNTLFFWAFEKTNGSLTNANSTASVSSSCILAFFYVSSPALGNQSLDDLAQWRLVIYTQSLNQCLTFGWIRTWIFQHARHAIRGMLLTVFERWSW
jgi:hypothetical protein